MLFLRCRLTKRAISRRVAETLEHFVDVAGTGVSRRALGLGLIDAVRVSAAIGTSIGAGVWPSIRIASIERNASVDAIDRVAVFTLGGGLAARDHPAKAIVIANRTAIVVGAAAGTLLGIAAICLVDLVIAILVSAAADFVFLGTAVKVTATAGLNASRKSHKGP